MAASDAFYQELLPEINEVLDELGTTYQVSTPGTYDEDEMTVGGPTKRPVVGLVADQSLVTSLGVIASDAQWVNRKVLLLKADAAIVENESIVVGGVTFPCNKIVELKPADVTVLFMLDITR